MTRNYSEDQRKHEMCSANARDEEIFNVLMKFLISKMKKKQ